MQYWCYQDYIRENVRPTCNILATLNPLIALSRKFSVSKDGNCFG